MTKVQYLKKGEDQRKKPTNEEVELSEINRIEKR